MFSQLIDPLYFNTRRKQLVDTAALRRFEKKFLFSAWCFPRNFLVNLGILFRNTSKWLFLKQCFRRHSIYCDFSFQPEPIRMVCLVTLTIQNNVSFKIFTYLRFLPFIADYLRLGYLVWLQDFANQFYSHLILRQSHFKAWFSYNHKISILYEMTSYRTIWRPLLSHTTCLFQVSYVCDFICAPFHFFLSRKIFATFDEVTLWDW